jgi:hypothetical protein
LIEERNQRAQRTRMASPRYALGFIGASKRPEVRAKISATMKERMADPEKKASWLKQYRAKRCKPKLLRAKRKPKVV